MAERKDARWFPRWAAWMQGTLPRPDWPTPEMPFWAELEREFVERRVTEREAASVVRAMFASKFFASDFPNDFLAGLGRLRRAAVQTAALPPEQAARAAEEAARDLAHREACEAVWTAFDEESRESWRALVRRRMRPLANRAKAVELLAMAWAAFPEEIPPEAPPRPAVGPGPRRVLPDRAPPDDPNASSDVGA